MTTRFKLRMDNKEYTARILHDSEWSEYVVKFYRHGIDMGEQVTYHTDDYDDACATAKVELERMGGAS